MPAIKSAAEIAAKWSSVTPTRTSFYEAGIKSPTVDWAKATSAAEQTYKTAVTEAANAGRFAKGVNQAGTAKWQKKAVEVGAGRWGPGVSIAGPDFQAGYAPYRDAIEKIVLKPRYPKGDPRNYERVAQIGTALNALKNTK